MLFYSKNRKFFQILVDFLVKNLQFFYQLVQKRSSNSKIGERFLKAFLTVFEDEIPYKTWGFGSRIVKITFFQKTKKCQREKRAQNPRKIFEKSVQKVDKNFWK